MHVGVAFCSYKTADLAVREEIVKKLSPHLYLCPFPVVSLFTCNRIEIYFSGLELRDKQKQLVDFLRQSLGTNLEEHFIYLFGKEAFLHLCQVTSGVDSAVFGETEIQNQVKSAYYAASTLHHLPSALHFLFQKSFKVAKGIRNECLLVKGLPSLKETIWGLASTGRSFLFIGFSEVNRRMIPFFLQKGCKVTLASRQKTAEEYAKKWGCSFFPWQKFHDLSSFDGVICSSRSDGYLIDQKIRSNKPILIFDLSMPRNVHPDVSLIPNISLYNLQMLDNLQRLKREKYQQAQHIAENMLLDEVDKLWEIYQEKTRRDQSLKLHVPRIPWKRDHVSDILHAGYEKDKPFKAYPKSAVGYSAILP